MLGCRKSVKFLPRLRSGYRKTSGSVTNARSLSCAAKGGENPVLMHKEVFKAVAVKWSAMSEDQKAEYVSV